jgi:hypothetical protein
LRAAAEHEIVSHTAMDEFREKPSQASPLESEVQNRIIASIVSESDRGAILVGSEHLNSVLEELLRLHLVDDADTQESMIGRDKPFGTFSSRIAGAYALGLITSETQKRLDQIRRIRNHCAHHVFEVAFTDQKIRDILMAMTGSPSGRASVNSAGQEAPLRVRFIWAVGHLAGQLSVSIACARGVGRPRDGKGFFHLLPLASRSRALKEGG